MTASGDAVERAARAWAAYIGSLVDAEAARTGARWTGAIVERIRKRERRRSFEAGWRAALDAAGVGDVPDSHIPGASEIRDAWSDVPGTDEERAERRQLFDAWLREVRAEAVGETTVLVQHAKGLVGHTYMGICPHPDDPDTRDPECLVCVAIDGAEWKPVEP